MRKVLFKKWIPVLYSEGKKVEGTGKYEDDFINSGIFHMWGSLYEEFDNGVGNYTVGIIELADGTIEEVTPTKIKFI